MFRSYQSYKTVAVIKTMTQNTSQSSDLYECTGPVYALLEQIGQLWSDTPTRYYSVYVSFGSKFNQPTQQFYYPPEIQTKQYPSNATFQMIPMFMREPSVGTNAAKKPSLVVVIDTFQESEWTANHQLLAQVWSEARAPLHIVMFNHSLTQKSLKAIVKGLANYCALGEIPPERCMFCNFIRFSSPNKIECEVECWVPTTIQKILDRPAYLRYNSCFYQWYGPSVFLYNLIYNYKKYDLFWMMHSRQLLITFLHSLPSPGPIGTDNVRALADHIRVLSPAVAKPWAAFCGHSFDICSERANDLSGLPPVYPFSLKYIQM